MRSEAHYCFVGGKVGGWDVLVFVVAFGHADKLTSQMLGCARLTENISARGENYAAMVKRGGVVTGRGGRVIWDAGRASFALGTTLVCRALMKMMAATRMISIVTRKAITTGLMDESPTRCSGVGLLVVGFCSLMD